MTRHDSTATRIADLWVDPLCPFAWITSRWLLEAARVRPIEPRFHVMSLVLLNQDRELSEEYRLMLEGALGPVRVLIAAQQLHGQEVVLPLYTAMGERMHVEGRGGTPDVVVDSLRAVGLPVELADAAGSTQYDAALRSSHDEAMDKVGDDVGTPVLCIGDEAIFGPVVTPAPKGEAAGLLWDGVLLVVGTEGFFELKRTRDHDLSFD